MIPQGYTATGLPAIDTMNWSEPKTVQTQRGERILRTCPPDAKFWDEWRKSKEQLRALGISCSKNKQTGDWEVCWWQDIDPAEKERRVAAVEASRKAEAEIVIPANEGLEYRGYQRGGVAYALAAFDAGKGCLIGDEMGLGKTIQAIGVINCRQDIRKVIVICPNSLKWNWEKELRKWLTRPMKIVVQVAGAPFAAELADIVVINYDIMARYSEKLQSVSWDLRILDEGHWCKNPDSKRSQASLGLPARHKITMTGTPIENKPRELWPLIVDLDPVTWNPKQSFQFLKRYCNGRKIDGYWDFDGSSNEQELQDRLRGSIMVRRMKADVLTELPPKVRQVIELPNADVQHLIAEEKALKRNAAKVRELEAKVQIAKAGTDDEYQAAVTELEESEQSLTIGEMALIRKELALAKVPFTIDYVNQLLDSDPKAKVIIFGHHLEPIRMLQQEWPTAAVITGETAAKERTNQVEMFQNSTMCRVFLGNDAAKEGLTLTAASWVVFHEGAWVPGNLAQKEDRAHRIGQTGTVFVTHLVFEGSLDCTMIKRTVEKQKVIDSVLDKVGEREAKAEAARTVDPIQKSEATVTVTRREIDIEAEKLTREQIDGYHQGLRMLAGVCDGARQEDGQGFSGLDAAIGHSLARQGYLTPRQGVIAKKLCLKYRRQLGLEDDL